MPITGWVSGLFIYLQSLSTYYVPATVLSALHDLPLTTVLQKYYSCYSFFRKLRHEEAKYFLRKSSHNLESSLNPEKSEAYVLLAPALCCPSGSSWTFLSVVTELLWGSYSLSGRDVHSNYRPLWPSMKDPGLHPSWLLKAFTISETPWSLPSAPDECSAYVFRAYLIKTGKSSLLAIPMIFSLTICPYCCHNKLPQIYWLKPTHIFTLFRSGDRKYKMCLTRLKAWCCRAGSFCRY